MAVKKGTATRRTNTTAKRPRSRAAAAKNGAGTFANFFVPLFFIIGILVCLGFLSLMGYRTVTASTFFDVKTVDIRGISRASKDDIEKIVSRQSEKTGVWNADLSQIKIDIEKLIFVKSAIVARVLPDGLRVSVNERVPRVVVKTEAGDFWADEDGVILTALGKNETRPPFALRGWDETKTTGAAKDNQERVKLYLKMLDDWNNSNIAKRVESVDLTNLRSPQAIVQDSGESVAIILPKDGFGKKLQTGIEKIAGRGKEVFSIDVSETQPVLGFRKKTEN